LNHSHLLLLIGINALWGFNFIAGKQGTTAFGPLLFITLRFAIVLLLLLFFIRWVPGQMKRIASIGFCMGIGHYAFMFYGIHLAGSLSSVAIAAQLTVPFATLLAILFLGERIGITRILAITASFTGVAIIGFEPFGPEHTIALLFTALASVAMATATILMKEYWSVLYSAIGATIIGHGLLYYLLQRHPIYSIAPFITLSTLFAILFGVLVYQDQLTLKIMGGGLLTLLGVTVVAVRNAKEDTPSSIRTPR